MGLTVYANRMGFFHKGSGGTGVATPDVCLSPPPPPAGPVPVPYVNQLSASDLTKGSSTVKIDGEPTALEDKSEVAMSTGDEGGTLGGNVITHRIKGKGWFLLWSFDVKVEGKGVSRHGDMMAQNTASPPAGAIDPQAVTRFLAMLKEENRGKPCPPDKKYPGNAGTNDAQKEASRGGPCWACGTKDSGRAARPAKGKCKAFKKGEYFTPDHQPPQKSAWNMGGCHEPEMFKDWAKSTEAVQPHCGGCSSSQGGEMSHAQHDSVLGWLTMGW